MQIQRGEHSFIFVYRFGAIVFYNFSDEEIEKELAEIAAFLGPAFQDPFRESFTVKTGEPSVEVEFEFVNLKKVTLDHLRILSLTLGQSVALESFESMADAMLSKSASIVERLSIRGSVPFFSKPLFKMVGNAASTRQNIIANLAVLDPPDETWKSKELENLYHEMQLNFEIDMRFRSLDRKLALLQNNIEILVDLNASRRDALLEGLIILLIVFEILMTILKI